MPAKAEVILALALELVCYNYGHLQRNYSGVNERHNYEILYTKQLLYTERTLETAVLRQCSVPTRASSTCIV